MDDPALLIETFRQASSISAVLGGLAFTAAAAVLSVAVGTSDSRALGPPATITAGAAVASAAGLIVAALTWSLLSTTATADAMLGREFDPTLLGVSRTATLAFLVGLSLLFVAIGASGWIGSRRLGTFTSAVAGLAGLVSLVIVFRFMS